MSSTNDEEHTISSRSVTPPAAQQPKSSPPNQLLWVYILCGLVVVLLVAMIIAFVMYKNRGKYRKKSSWANRELANECNPSFRYKSTHKLSKLTEKLMNKENVADEFTSEYIGSPSDDRRNEKDGKTTEIKNSLNATVQCLKRTQLRLKSSSDLLNLNTMNDFCNNPLILGQIPSENEFETFWQAIDELNPCVIVWFDEPGSPGPYHLPIRQLLIAESYGAYSARNSGAVAFFDQLKIHDVQYVKGTEFINGKFRTLIVVQITKWPCVMDDPIELEKLLKTVEDVAKYQQMQSVLPGKSKTMIIQCKNGTEQSATFTACYIGRQMWLSDYEVNPNGIMRYIRTCRHGAFTSTKMPGVQIRIVFSVLTYLAITFPNPKEFAGAVSGAEGTKISTKSISHVPKVSVAPKHLDSIKSVSENRSLKKM